MPKYYHRPGTLPKSAHKKLQYKVVLYLNKKQQKTLYKSRTIYPSRKKYDEFLSENTVYFPKKWNWLGKRVQYQLLLLGNWGEVMDKYQAPSGVVYNVGRARKDGFVIKDIQPYYVEEKFKYHNANKMITFKELMTFMAKERNSKTLIVFNNKLIVEIFEKDEVHVFILKNKDDAERLYATVKKFYYLNKMSDCFFFKKPTRGLELTDYIERITENTGISRRELNKTSTRA